MSVAVFPGLLRNHGCILRGGRSIPPGSLAPERRDPWTPQGNRRVALSARRAMPAWVAEVYTHWRQFLTESNSI
jgi:hypothetical protein